MYYLNLITVLLAILARHVVSQTMTTTTTTTATPTTTTPTMTTTTTPIDFDAVLQRSIDCQVLAEMEAERVAHQLNRQVLSKTKAERVLQYCIDQSTHHRAARQKKLDYQLCCQLSQLSLMKKVRWANDWDNSDLDSTEAETVLDTIPDSSCSWGTGIHGGIRLFVLPASKKNNNEIIIIYIKIIHWPATGVCFCTSNDENTRRFIYILAFSASGMISGLKYQPSSHICRYNKCSCKFQKFQPYR
ncbi:hypothetical protein BGX38DRAFT_39704 [Terfezia claveryi]|nr:hypothetical protein BGX38DRAFT_39704 [Terfezia claveryi]